MSARYFNWKLMIVLVLGLAVFGVGTYSLHQWRLTNSADEGLELGGKAYAEQRWQDAAEHLGRYLAVKQDDTSALLKYADAQLKIRPTARNRIQQAIGAYRTVLRIEKRNSEAAKRLTEIYLGIGSAGEAELIARREIENNPDPEIRRMLALALIGQRKFEEAVAELKSIVKERPDQILAYERLGQLVEQRPEDFAEKPAVWFDQAIANNPSSALAYIVRAAFYRRNKNVSAALADLEDAQKLDLSDASVRVRLAKELISMGLLERAEEHLRAVREVAATDQELWQTWARLALRSRSQEKMLDVAKTGLAALSFQPWDFMPLAAELFVLGGNFDDANDCISKLHAKDIGPAKVAFLRGLVAGEQGRLSEAVRYWRQSMESGNKSPHIRVALASALSGLGDLQSAILQLRTVVSENPDHFEGRLALARLLAQTGSWAEVAEQASAAMQLSPEDVDAALLHIQATAHLLRAGPDQQAKSGGQIKRDVQQQLSALERSHSEATAQITLIRFELALEQGDIAEAQKLAGQLGQAGLAQAKIALAEAELLAAQSKEDQAIERLSAAMEEFPNNVELVSYAAILLDRQKDLARCEDVLKRALTRANDRVSRRRLGLLLAQFYVSWDQKDKVYPMLTGLSKELPSDVPLKRRLLLCEKPFENTEIAQRLVDEIKSIEGESGWQWRFEQARVWFASERFEDNYARIVSLLQENLVANPDDQASRVFLARVYERANAMQLALSTYRQALNRSPDDLRVIIPAVSALYRAKEYDQAEQILARASKQNLSHPLLSQLVLQDHLRRGEINLASGVLQDILNGDPNNQGACLSLALLKMQQGEFGEAATLLTNLRKQDPNSLAITSAQIQLSIRQDKPDEAMRYSDQAVNTLGNAAAYVLRARTRATLGQDAKAWEDLERATSMEAENTGVWIARSDFNRAAGRHAEAVADIKRAISLAPDDLDVEKRAISLFLASKQQAVNQEGKLLLEEALATNPDDIELRLYKARSLLGEGTTTAIDDAEQVLKKITQDGPESSDAWVLLGEIAIQRGQPDKAMSAALGGLAYRPTDKALLLLKARAEAARSPVLALPTLEVLHSLDVNSVDAALLLANTYLKAGQMKKALTLLRKQLDRSDATNRRRYEIALAVATYKNGNRQRAEKDLDSLLKADPNDPTPLVEIVQLLKEDRLWSNINERVVKWLQGPGGNAQAAVTIATGLLSIDDNEAKRAGEDILRTILRSDPGCARAIGALAMLLQSTDRTEEAANLYERLLAIEPDNLIAINNLAWIMCEEQNKHREALELAQRGLKIDPEYLDLVDTRGVIYYRLREFEKAAEDFKTCIAKTPNTTPSSVATRFHLARALVELGDKGQAITQLSQALDLQPRIGGLSHEEHRQAQRLLRQLGEGT